LKPSLPALPAVDLLGHDAPNWGIVAVFGVVYVGMFPGRLPRLKLYRSGVALLGATAGIAFAGQSAEEARCRPTDHRAALHLHGGLGADVNSLHRRGAEGAEVRRETQEVLCIHCISSA
jgi:hypothetical protein